MKYHIRRSEKQITDRNEIQSILEKGKYGIIGLANGDEPYVVTLSYGYDKSSNCIYFHCAKEGQKIDFIKNNPKACVTILEDDGFNTDSCTHSYKTVVIRGEITFVEDKNEIQSGILMMINQLEKKEPEKIITKLQEGDKHFDYLQILKLEIEEITGKKQD